MVLKIPDNQDSMTFVHKAVKDFYPDGRLMSEINPPVPMYTNGSSSWWMDAVVWLKRNEFEVLDKYL